VLSEEEMFVARTRMHADELDIDVELVRRLLTEQMPHWAELPLKRVEHAGTDHAIFRLGAELSVRLPRIAWAAGQPDKESSWLPALAPQLPAPIPVPLAKGDPGEGYPWHWLVSPWMRGQDATPKRVRDDRFARDLAAFIDALQGIDAEDGPRPGRHNFLRGVPLQERDAAIRTAIPHWKGVFDTRALVAAWEEALAAPAWEGQPVWLHGDLASGNVLVDGGRLSAVIDFGCLGVGDPACDLSAAWTILAGKQRGIFRSAIARDDATWARARGWALMGVGALPYYAQTNPAQVARARRIISEVLAESATDDNGTH
jgi:aminoglycoside phosphotransferase (APT) family kinase protein